MGGLSVSVLGAPEIRHAEAGLTFRTRKTLALLVYLAVESGIHPREKLATLLWPDLDGRAGRGMVRNTLTYLRQALREPAESHLTVDAQTIGLRAEAPLTCDVYTLREAALTARTAAGPLATHTGTGGNALQAAAAAYRGPFLEGFSLGDAPEFEDWVRMQRELAQQQAGSVLDRLSYDQMAAGNLADAAEMTLRWAALDPLQEPAQQRLMQLHWSRGDAPAALRAYEAFAARLAQELGARPGPATTAMARRIRAAGSLASPSHPAGAPAPLSPGLPPVPFAGRATEIGHLMAQYRAVQAGALRVVVVQGEAGMGKTRLATEFLQWALAEGADIVQGRAYEIGGRVAYQLLVDAWRSRLDAENAPADLLSDPWLAELARLLPELHERYPDLPTPPADDATARVRVFEALVRVAQALAARAPLVLCFDDLQWADTTSLDVLHYAVRRWAESETAVLLILNLRSEALASDTALAPWLAGLAHTAVIAPLVLAPLPWEATRGLVHALHREPETDRPGAVVAALTVLARWLFDETDGHPFYMIETLKVLLDRGMLAARQDAGGAWRLELADGGKDAATLRGVVPPGVRAVIRTRLAPLTAPGRDLLVAGAVLGRSFPFAQVCEVAGLAELAGLAALDELLAHHLIEEAPAAARPSASPGHLRDPLTYGFTHDKIRHVVYEESSAPRRRLFHARALRVLEIVAAPAAILAQHALAADLPVPAFTYSQAAGDAALRVFASHDAIWQYEQARALLETVAAAGPIALETLRQLYLQLGRAYELASAFDQAHAVYTALLATAQQTGQAGMEAAALTRLALLAMQAHYDLTTAGQLLERALSAASAGPEETVLAETEWALAQVAFYRFDAAATRHHATRALARARALDLPDLVGRCLNVRGYAGHVDGQWAAAERDAAEAVPLYHALGNRAMEADCLAQVARARLGAGRPAGGLRAAQAAYAISAEIDNYWGQANSSLHLAMATLDLGRYGEALAAATACVSLARQHGMPALLACGLVVAGAVHRVLLQPAAALATHVEALAVAEEVGAAAVVQIVAEQLCADCAVAGTWDAALAYGRRALGTGPAPLIALSGLAHWYVTAALVQGQACIEAAEDTRHFGARVSQAPRYRIAYLRSQAILAQAAGSSARALARLSAAAVLAAALGLPGERWAIELAAGAVAGGAGRPDVAEAAFGRAGALAAGLAGGIPDAAERAAFLAAACRANRV